MVSVEYSEAIVEVLDILNNSDKDVYEKIPNKLIQFWQRNKSTEYQPNLDHSKSLNEMQLKDKTKDIIAMLYLNYLCDESEKKDTIEILIENEEAYQNELRKKYNPNNIFKDKQTQEEHTKMIEYKEQPWYKKIFAKILGIFKKN